MPLSMRCRVLVGAARSLRCRWISLSLPARALRTLQSVERPRVSVFARIGDAFERAIESHHPEHRSVGADGNAGLAALERTQCVSVEVGSCSRVGDCPSTSLPGGADTVTERLQAMSDLKR